MTAKREVLTREDVEYMRKSLTGKGDIFVNAKMANALCDMALASISPPDLAPDVRDRVIEECARVAEQCIGAFAIEIDDKRYPLMSVGKPSDALNTAATAIAAAIRALLGDGDRIATERTCSANCGWK